MPFVFAISAVIFVAWIMMEAVFFVGYWNRWRRQQKAIMPDVTIPGNQPVRSQVGRGLVYIQTAAIIVWPIVEAAISLWILPLVRKAFNSYYQLTLWGPQEWEFGLFSFWAD